MQPSFPYSLLLQTHFTLIYCTYLDLAWIEVQYTHVHWIRVKFSSETASSSLLSTTRTWSEPIHNQYIQDMIGTDTQSMPSGHDRNRCTVSAIRTWSGPMHSQYHQDMIRTDTQSVYSRHDQNRYIISTVRAWSEPMQSVPSGHDRNLCTASTIMQYIRTWPVAISSTVLS